MNPEAGPDQYRLVYDGKDIGLDLSAATGPIRAMAAVGREIIHVDLRQPPYTPFEPTFRELMEESVVGAGRIPLVKSPPDPIAYRTEPYPGLCAVTIGVHHAGDNRDHLNYQVINEEWDRFLAATEEGKRIAFYEGRRLKEIPRDEEASYTGGRTETRRPAYLATQACVPFRIGEPNRLAETKHLLQKFDPAHVVYYYFARQIPQRNRVRADIRPSFESYLRQTYDSYYKQLRLHKIPECTRNNILGWMASVHETIFDQPFDPKDDGFMLEQTTNYFHQPVGYVNPIRKITAECNMYRDTALLSLYKKYWEKGWSTFDVRGWPHVYTIRPFLLQDYSTGRTRTYSVRGLDTTDIQVRNTKGNALCAAYYGNSQS